MKNINESQKVTSNTVIHITGRRTGVVFHPHILSFELIHIKVTEDKKFPVCGTFKQTATNSSVSIVCKFHSNIKATGTCSYIVSEVLIILLAFL